MEFEQTTLLDVAWMLLLSSLVYPVGVGMHSQFAVCTPHLVAWHQPAIIQTYSIGTATVADECETGDAC